jgi:hypothetical protein
LNQSPSFEKNFKTSADRNSKKINIKEKTRRLETPPPVTGRKHFEVQTDTFLEELVDKIPEADKGTETDPFLDRPASPLFIPKKLGVDVETQIYEGELFDFSEEVKPILEVLVGKTLEQALTEVLTIINCKVLEERELEILRIHQKKFRSIRHSEVLEAQRLEAAERRRHEERVDLIVFNIRCED